MLLSSAPSPTFPTTVTPRCRRSSHLLPIVAAPCTPWQVEALRGFGAANTESLADLVWSFFEYWAWRHDYYHTVISVRTGQRLTKAAKAWVQKIGTERHLVCACVLGGGEGGVQGVC